MAAAGGDMIGAIINPTATHPHSIIIEQDAEQTVASKGPACAPVLINIVIVISNFRIFVP